ncbi:MAG: hypothetical protein Q9219_004535 [cf. Caloplaca sp. 3 TL-2023]
MAAPIFAFDGAEERSAEEAQPSLLGVYTKTSAVQGNKSKDVMFAKASSEEHIQDTEHAGQQATLGSAAPELHPAGAKMSPINAVVLSELDTVKDQRLNRPEREQSIDVKPSQPPIKPSTAGIKQRQKRICKEERDVIPNIASGFASANSEGEHLELPKEVKHTGNDFTLAEFSKLRSDPCRSSPGISALTQQLESLQCGANHRRGHHKNRDLRIKTKVERSASIQSTSASPTPSPSASGSQSSATSESVKDSESSKTISYEVARDHDFISPDMVPDDIQQYSDPLILDHLDRKMTASDFEPLRCLGKGTYGTVHLVKQARTGRLFAQKQFRKASLTVKQQLVEQTKTERAILESINRHPYVVKLFYAFQDQEKLYLILEYAQGGELFTRMMTEGMFPEDTAAFYMAEMILALDHLHGSVSVVYRDLKPENCLLDADGHLLLTDFGLSKVAVDGDFRCRSMTGTLEYMAPEVVQQQSYGPEVDWWSFAILGFEMLVGHSPFYANNDAKIQEKIVKSKLVLPFFMSADAKDLLTRLLRKKPKERLGARMPKDLQLIKSHRFFRKIDWKKLSNRQVEPPFKPVITDPELAENFSAEFTEIAVSPVTAHPKRDWGLDSAISDPFGGFSFVASRSLLDAHNGTFYV